ncbi:PQQ-binding-like beta-propeller repeat protein [Bremerella sp. JC817]|uniref:outer membrane protein assembly factor BamB family protein n=1 Tax=Bremerella sp. JC817 TaxID=3231756 RepID=UPI003459F97C
MKTPRFCWKLLSTILCLLPLADVARAGDWPQILGPDRNGHAQDESLLDEWPDRGPQEVWKRNLGTGYAGPAISDGVVYLFHREAASELLEAVELKTGKKIWARDMRASYQPSINPDDGPRCVPVVTEDSVIVFGAAGILRSVDRQSGKLKWEVDLAGQFGAPDGYFGFGSTPIVYDKTVMVNVGGRNGAGIVAVRLADGQFQWRATDDAASYSSPVMASIAGRPYAVFVTRMQTVVVDPFTGSVLYGFPFGARGPTVNAATPIVSGDKLFVTSSYGVGAKLVELDKNQFKPIWENDDTLSSQYNTPVLVDGYLYGIHGREDLGRPELRCVELATGKVMWQESNLGTAHLLYADGKLIAVTNEGTAILFRPEPKKFSEISRFRASNDIVRALPALSGGYLLVRETGTRGGPVRCFQIGKPSEP